MNPAYRSLLAPLRRGGLAVLAILLVLAPPVFAADYGPLRIHGYLDMEYIQADKNEGHDRGNAGDRTNGAFDQHHLNFLIDIAVLPELLIKSQIEYDHGADSELGYGGIILEYGFAEYTVSDLVQFRGGKMLTPFGFFNEIHDASPAFTAVSVPRSVYQTNTRGGFAMVPKWVTGLSVFGEEPFGRAHHDLSYVLYVANGENRASINETQYDDNANKALGGRLQFATHEEEFKAAWSFYTGDKAVSEERMNEGHTTHLFSLEGILLNSLTLRGEYAMSSLADQDQAAWYVEAAYRQGRYTPYVRYEFADPDTSVADDHWATSLAGVNIRINDHLFFKLEYDHHERGAANRDIEIEGNEEFSEYWSVLTIFF